ncbi:MAG: N-acetylglucosamine-6-phosphate deacetylase [Aquimonas sp.]|nr:N-acetylglucosamine-6-phosphate deacetylase [Aquimonas sp.]
MTRLLIPDRLLAPTGLREDLALLIEDGCIAALPEKTQLDGLEQLPRLALPGALLAPGFVDLQVNGGGGLLFNDAPAPETLATITRAHRRRGTTSILATLISDSPQKTRAAQAAVAAALAMRMPGLLGLHLEGPHLNPERCGVHQPEHFRALDQTEVDALLAARSGPLLLTLAPERVLPAQIQRLTAAGVRVFAGHTAASFEQVQAALAAGLVGFTHLFNAMPPIAGRAPGPVAAALLDASSYVSLIADGLHLHPANLQLALHCKPRGRCLLVSDAMPSVGAAGPSEFELQGRTVQLREGRLQTAEGTLAGAHLDLAGAVRYLVQSVGVALDEALRMASTWPAEAMGVGRERGSLRIGSCADLVWLDDALEPRGTWIAGEFEAA